MTDFTSSTASTCAITTCSRSLSVARSSRRRARTRVVTAGPTCPVEREPPDPACAERPVAGAVLVFTDAGGLEVARVTSAADGTFTVELAPGAYHVSAEPVEGLMGTPGPMDVEVEAGQMTELQVSYDTGIR